MVGGRKQYPIATSNSPDSGREGEAPSSFARGGDAVSRGNIRAQRGVSKAI
jgi:hypothetical protein